MLAHDARNLAIDWLSANSADIPDFVGAFLSGSVAWMKPDSAVSPGSDIDIFVVIGNSDLPPRPGKLRWKNAVLEINYLSLDGIADINAVLADYHLASAFRCDGVLSDPTGKITTIRHDIGKEFAKTHWVRQRCSKVRDRARQRVTKFNNADALHDKVTTFFFGAGLCPHMILVADLANPTIRRRYIAARTVLERRRKLDLHEQLLSTLGSKAWSRRTAENHLADVVDAFDLACSVLRSPYQFASDMTFAARPIAVDGSLEMIRSGFHREAAFWLIAIMSRCRAVIVMDGSADQTAGMDCGYWRLLRSLGIENEEALDARSDQALTDITACWDLCCAMMDGADNPDQA